MKFRINIKRILITITILAVVCLAVTTYFYVGMDITLGTLQEELESISIFIPFCTQYNVSVIENTNNGHSVYAVVGLNVSVPRIQNWLDQCCVQWYNETQATVVDCPLGTDCYGELCVLNMMR